jgi:hypothetical protein
LMVGGHLPKHPSVSQLTSRPDSVLSKCRRSRHVKFQHKSRRHLAASLSSLLEPARHGALGLSLPRAYRCKACSRFTLVLPNNGRGGRRRTEYALKWKHDTRPPANIVPTIISVVR